MYRLFIKRLLDILLSACLLVVLSPAMLVVAFLVRIKLGGPVIFKQVRPGLNATLFTIYKFRTMTDEKSPDGFFLPDEKRLTKFGAGLRSTSLDELPELWNILKGDMSFVGPRPQLVRDMTFFTPEQMRRQQVRPGLTGWAQVNGRNCITWQSKLAYDIEYLDDISLATDAAIVWKTISLVFRREGISAAGCATAEDLGDALLAEGVVARSEYENKQREAALLIERYEALSTAGFEKESSFTDRFSGVSRALDFLCDGRMSTLFRVAYLLLALISFNSVFAFTSGLTYAAYVCAAWGGILICARLLRWRRYVRFPHVWLLGVFLISYAVSAIMTPYPEMGEAAQGFTWLTLQFFMLYLWDAGDSFDKAKKEFFVFASVFVVYTFVASIASLCMAVGGFSYTDAANIMQQRNIGMVNGRLWGVYSDPNYGSVLAVVSVLFSVLLLRSRRSALRLVFMVITVVVQVSYIALSGSRTGLLAMMVAFAVTTVFLTHLHAVGLRKLSRFLVGCGLVAIVLTGSFVVYQAAVSSYNNFFAIENAVISGRDSAKEEVSADVRSDNSPARAGVVQREELVEDESSGRLRIWSDAWGIFCDNPLFGVSYRSVGDYANGMIPNSFIAHRGYTSMHNVFLDIMVGQGLFGLIPFVLVLVLGVLNYADLLKRLDGEDATLAVICGAVLGSILLSAFLYSEIVYINTAGSVVFWTVLGFVSLWHSKMRVWR